MSSALPASERLARPGGARSAATARGPDAPALTGRGRQPAPPAGPRQPLVRQPRHRTTAPADRLGPAGLLQAALRDPQRGLGTEQLQAEAAAVDLIARAADGDARRALNMLELAAGLMEAGGAARLLTLAVAQEVASGGQRRFDKGGDQFYQQISALHKAVRGTDPDAARYWLCRMLDGGCDPRYIARRVTRMAVEDIGLADPRALALALDGWEAYERLGTPEGELAVATAVVYLACAPKSNALYVAMGEAMADVGEFGTLDVPLRLRNAPTRLMKNLGYGRDYRYAHDEPEAFAAGERYLPDEMPDRRYYRPVARGLEVKIGEALARLRARTAAKG